MNKKIGVIIAVIIVIVAVVGIVIFANNKTENQENVSDNNEVKINEETTNNEITGENKKVLVVYYSAQNHTKTVAEKIADNLNADTFEIVPERVYTSADLDWTNNNSRVSKEHNDETLRDVKLTSTKVENWDNYDTILIGYPIWWRNCSMASRYFYRRK